MTALKLWTILFLLGFLDFSLQNVRSQRVMTSLGPVRGYQKISRHGKEYEAYEGIPYAKPPLGKLRFQPPQPVGKWSDEPGTKKGSACMQFAIKSLAPDGNIVSGSEDCLYINIYVPLRSNSDTLLPVIFWIHGGAFLFGSGNEMNESLIMDRDVLLVTVNYRLGPFGFLSTGDSEVPGNMGLKDQSVALRWVSRHIENFGGNPKDITLLGFSAGAASVHYHYLSPMSRGLFQRGISVSGVALDPWAQTKRAPEKAKKLAAVVGCPTSRERKMIHCLQNRTAEELSLAVGDLMYWLYNPFSVFGPVVEDRGSETFISHSPVDVIDRGEVYDVPWITGVVSEEGCWTAAEFVANDTLLKHLNDNWDDIAPYLLDFNDTIPVNHHTQVAEKIRKHYLGSEPIDSKTVMPIIHMMRDRHFAHSYEKAVRLQAKKNKSPVWNYFYSYRSMYSLSETMSRTTRNFGVSHSDDIYLIIDTKTSSVTRSQDVDMQQILLDFYTSFAIEGKPRVDHADWQTLNPHDKEFRYLHISNPETIQMESASDFAEGRFWNSINFNENKIH